MSLLRARLHERTIPAAERRPEGTIPLADLACGRCSIIVGFVNDAPPEVTRRLFDLGFVPGAEVGAVRRAPLVDPIIVSVAGYEIAIRRAQASLIDVSAA